MTEFKNLITYSADQNSKKILIASGPVILNENGEVLLVKTESSKWKFPGGTVKDDESFRETAIREAKEEVDV